MRQRYSSIGIKGEGRHEIQKAIASVFGVALLSFALNAFAVEPLEFKGLRIGSAVEAVKAKSGAIECHVPKEEISKSENSGEVIAAYRQLMALGDTVCWANFPEDPVKLDEFSMIGGHPSSRMMFSFINNQLVNAEATIESSAFDDLLGVIASKYGQPAKKSASTVQNQMGAQFTNQEVIWKRAGSTLTLKKYDDRIDHGSYSLQSDSYDSILKKRAATRKKDAAKGL